MDGPLIYLIQDPQHDSQYNLKSSLVNRRGIYKDTCGSTHEYTDYQFRPNFGIAMVMVSNLHVFVSQMSEL